MSNIYSISSLPFYDNINQIYTHIYIFDRKPLDNALISISKNINMPQLSPFKGYNNNQCVYAVLNPDNNSQLLKIGEEPILFSFLFKNNININSQLTKVLNKNTRSNHHNSELLCIVSI